MNRLIVGILIFQLSPNVLAQVIDYEFGCNLPEPPPSVAVDIQWEGLFDTEEEFNSEIQSYADTLAWITPEVSGFLLFEGASMFAVSLTMPDYSFAESSLGDLLDYSEVSLPVDSYQLFKVTLPPTVYFAFNNSLELMNTRLDEPLVLKVENSLLYSAVHDQSISNLRSSYQEFEQGVRDQRAAIYEAFDDEQINEEERLDQLQSLESETTSNPFSAMDSLSMTPLRIGGSGPQLCGFEYLKPQDKYLLLIRQNTDGSYSLSGGYSAFEWKDEYIELLRKIFIHRSSSNSVMSLEDL